MKSNFANRAAWMVRWFAGAAVLAGAAIAVAQTSKPGDVDVDSSRVYVFVGATGLGHEHGVEGKLTSGHVNLGAAQQAGELTFDMNSFVVDTPAARKYVGLSGEADGTSSTANMLGADVLNVAQFPQATFTISSAAFDSTTGQYTLDGQFTLHGVSQQFQIPCSAETVDGKVHLRGKFTMQQTQFGITPYSKAFGAIGVADKLTIWGDLWLTAAGGAQR